VLALALPAALFAVAGFSACERIDVPLEHEDPPPEESGTGRPPGELVAHPAYAGSGSRWFFVEPHSSGQAAAPRVVGVRWGRLVELHSLEPSGERELQFARFAVGPDAAAGTLVETNPLTQRTQLVIPHGADTAAFRDAVVALDASLLALPESQPRGEGPEIPPNAVLVVMLDDLLDARSVSVESVRLLTGSPTVVPFAARVFADANHGGLVREGGRETFHSTRVIVDPTVGPIERRSSPLPLNLVGLPMDADGRTRVELRLPTVAEGSGGALVNLAGRPLAGPGVDLATPTRDIVFRTQSALPALARGGDALAFLGDVTPPEIVGTQIVDIVVPPRRAPGGGPQDFFLPQVDFLSNLCATTPERGDLIQQASFLAEVVEAPNPVSNGSVFRLRVMLLAGNPTDWITGGAGSAQLLTTYDPVDNAGQAGCFLEITPLAAGYPANPVLGVSPASEIGVRFTEPIQRESIAPFDTLLLTREADAELLSDFVVGETALGVGLASLTFVPELPLAHVFGAEDDYFLTLAAGPMGPKDIAGNELAAGLEHVLLTLAAFAPEELNGGRLARFLSDDEEPPFGGPFDPMREFSGQHFYPLGEELIRPRPVIHYPSVADRSRALPALMEPFERGVQSPLAPLGSIVQTVWRYVDVGMSLTDATEFNIDVEGLSWAPIGGQVIADHFDRFEIRLAHSRLLPDEYIDPASLFPKWFNSGLKTQFLNNVADPDVHPQAVVHPRGLGYTVTPGDLYTAVSGTVMMPFPLNRTVPADEFRYYTWRDTAILARHGPQGGGADPWQLAASFGQPPPPPFYSVGQVPSVGLPLLMEFRTYPEASALGLNSFDISLAANSSARPFFRTFSTGGVDQAGVAHIVDPDLEIQGNGGYNPTSVPPGAGLPGQDPVFYIGAMDLVVRVSRSYSIWFEAVGPDGVAIPAPEYPRALVGPRADDQPPGTHIELAFRGATDVVNFDAVTDATSLDAYGDHYADLLPPLNHDADMANVGISFLNGDAGWFDDVGELDGARFYQVRITFVADPVTGALPELSSLGLTWF